VEIKHPNYFKESGWDDDGLSSAAGYSLGVICGMPKKAFRGGDSIYIDCKRGGERITIMNSNSVRTVEIR